MPTTAEIDAAFSVAQDECRWSANKVNLVRRMLEAAERVRAAEAERAMAGFSDSDIDDIRRDNQ